MLSNSSAQSFCLHLVNRSVLAIPALLLALASLLAPANGFAQAPPPLAVFASEDNRPNGSKVIDMSSGHSTLTGRTHCNSDIDVSGTANYFRTGIVEHVTGIHPVPNFQGKVTLQNCPVVVGAVAPFPVDYQVVDFAPSGSEAVAAQAAGKYYHILGDTQLSAFMNNGELREGLYYVEGKVTISKGSLHGRITIVTTKEIIISGQSETWQPYTRCLLLFSTKALTYNQAAINISGGSSQWEGVIYAPNGGAGTWFVVDVAGRPQCAGTSGSLAGLQRRQIETAVSIGDPSLWIQ